MTRVSAPELQQKFCVELTWPEDIAWERTVKNQHKLRKITTGKGYLGLKFRDSIGPTTSALRQQSDTTAIKGEPVAAVRAQSRTSG